MLRGDRLKEHARESHPWMLKHLLLIKDHEAFEFGHWRVRSRLFDPSDMQVRYDHVAAIWEPDGDVWVGVAVCSPLDEYNKKIGYRIAAGRALHRFVTPGLDPSAREIELKDLRGTAIHLLNCHTEHVVRRFIPIHAGR